MDKIRIVTKFPAPVPQRKRLIWQPVTDSAGKMMRLAPLDWLPSGAHEALEHLARENDKLRDDLAKAEDEIAFLKASK